MRDDLVKKLAPVFGEADVIWLVSGHGSKSSLFIYALFIYDKKERGSINESRLASRL